MNKTLTSLISAALIGSAYAHVPPDGRVGGQTVYTLPDVEESQLVRVTTSNMMHYLKGHETEFRLYQTTSNEFTVITTIEGQPFMYGYIRNAQFVGGRIDMDNDGLFETPYQKGELILIDPAKYHVEHLMFR